MNGYEDQGLRINHKSGPFVSRSSTILVPFCRRSRLALICPGVANGFYISNKEMEVPTAVKYRLSVKARIVLGAF